MDRLGTFDVEERDPATGRVVLALKAGRSASSATLAVRQVLETIRNRIDQFGVAEPTIQQQGDNRILIQLPGVQDPERAKALIGKTALLEFKLLDDKVDAEQARGRASCPQGSSSSTSGATDKETKQERKIPYVVQKQVLLTGGELTRARGLDRSEHAAALDVSVEFNAAGAKAFGEVTEANVGRQLAIVLDGNVHSAPSIRERIPSGRAVRSPAGSRARRRGPRDRPAGGRAAGAGARSSRSARWGPRSAPTRSARA